jgi:hypothetical protein
MTTESSEGDAVKRASGIVEDAMLAFAFGLRVYNAAKSLVTRAGRREIADDAAGRAASMKAAESAKAARGTGT